MGKKDKEVEEALNKLEQGIEKIAEVFDQYTETVRQEIAFINQRIMDLESKIDSTASWSSFTGEGREAARRIPYGTGVSSEISSPARQKPTPPVSKPLAEANAPPEREYTPPAKTYTASLREAEAASGRGPTSPTRQPVRRELEPAGFVTREDLGGGESSREEGFGGYRPARGGIVEEKYVKPSVFSREMNKLEAAAAAAPQTQYGPGGYPLPPSMQLRSQISTVLGKIKPEAQRRAPRPEPAPGYGAAPGYQAPRRPPTEEEYGSPQPASPAYTTAPPPDSAGGEKAISVPDNWLPDSSRAKYYNPKNLKKGDVKEMEKKTKDIFK